MCELHHYSLTELKILNNIALLFLNKSFWYDWARTHVKDQNYAMEFLNNIDQLNAAEWCFKRGSTLLDDPNQPNRKKRITEIAMLHSYACLEAMKGNYASARTKMLDVYNSFSAIYAHDKPHHLIAEPAANLAFVLMKEKKWNDAVFYLTDSLSFYLNRLPDLMHPQTDLIFSKLSDMLDSVEFQEEDVDLCGLMKVFGLAPQSKRESLLEHLKRIQMERPDDRRYPCNVEFIISCMY